MRGFLHPRGLALLLILTMLLAAGAASAASLRITSGGAKAGPYTLTVAVADFSLAPVSSSPVNRAGEGHIHYLLNGKAAPGDYATDRTSFTFASLANGDEVGAELVNNDHTSLSPRTLATSKVGASTPGFDLLLALGAVAAALAVLRRRP